MHEHVGRAYRCCNSVSVSPDGKQVVSGSEDITLCSWVMGTGQCTSVLEGLSNEFSSAGLSPDGKQVDLSV
jgi:WD40 repeat protein